VRVGDRERKTARPSSLGRVSNPEFKATEGPTLINVSLFWVLLLADGRRQQMNWGHWLLSNMDNDDVIIIAALACVAAVHQYNIS
jgi:hypothetical protein